MVAGDFVFRVAYLANGSTYLVAEVVQLDALVGQLETPLATLWAVFTLSRLDCHRVTRIPLFSRARHLVSSYLCCVSISHSRRLIDFK